MRKLRFRDDQHPVQACCKTLVNARVQSYFLASSRARVTFTRAPSKVCEHNHCAEPASVVCGHACVQATVEE